MEIFSRYDNIPEDFEGECYIEDYEIKFFIKNKIFHRKNGPAVIHDCGTMEWYQDGHRHRLDGPALCVSNTKMKYQEFYIDDKQYSEKEYWNHPLVIEYKLKHILETC